MLLWFSSNSISTRNNFVLCDYHGNRQMVLLAGTAFSAHLNTYWWTCVPRTQIQCRYRHLPWGWLTNSTTTNGKTQTKSEELKIWHRKWKKETQRNKDEQEEESKMVGGRSKREEWRNEGNKDGMKDGGDLYVWQQRTYSDSKIKVVLGYVRILGTSHTFLRQSLRNPLCACVCVCTQHLKHHQTEVYGSP